MRCLLRIGTFMAILSSPLMLPYGTFASEPCAEPPVTLRGEILDAEGERPVAARLYLRSDDGKWLHARSVGGEAVRYSKIVGESQEVHTSLSAKPFEAALPVGRYQITVERGKEYLTTERTIEIKPEHRETPLSIQLSVRRWTHMARSGWYSGDTHVHRKVAELPTAVLADDVNVAFPLTYWVTDSTETPATANKNREPIPPARLIRVDDTHVIWPVNTEYEIFTVRRKRHTLGALFILNHTRPLTLAAPGVEPIVREARLQNEDVILDMDKHNWPWSMMLPPVAGVELFELTNNHVWRTKFRFSKWYPEYVADYMNIDMDAEGGFTERGWIDFGFRNYYALLNCGFAMKPTGGTASGVHPVPLGFGRVYVQLEGPFSYAKWLRGLKAGRSFVTTGPVLTATFNGQPHGAVFDGFRGDRLHVKSEARSPYPIQAIEVVVNGRVRQRLTPRSREMEGGGYRGIAETSVPIKGSSWIALRCFEDRPDGRPRFAHTSPVHIAVEGKPLRPSKAEVDYLVKRVRDELVRHEDVLDEAALDEFRQSIQAYESKR